MILSIYTDLLKYIRFVEIFLFINTKHHTVKIQMGEKFLKVSERELQSFIKIYAYLELWFQLLNIKRIQCCNGAEEDF